MAKSQTAEQVTLYTGHEVTETSVLLSESLNCAILDSGCSSTVAGHHWMQCYLDSLTSEEMKEVVRKPGSTVFQFGGGEKLRSTENITIPCQIGGEKYLLEADVVKSGIPLLLSRPAMKKVGMKLDLVNDKAEVHGKSVDLMSTSSGHYAMPLRESVTAVEDVLVLFSAEMTAQEKEKAVIKIHKQFAHPTKDRLKTLLSDAGVYDEQCDAILDWLSKNCETCLKFRKTPARPVVGLPLATEFNGVVVMDLKEKVKGKVWYLHLIDAATRFSVSNVIYNKKPATVIDKIMTSWIGAGFGAPAKFLADNGGEFANAEYRDMCENLNVECCNTAAYSPWQNGLCERNHAVVDEMVEKLLADTPAMPIEVALVWAVHAKNCLSMNYGYSSYQLVFGQNPNLPNVLTDNPPALEGTSISETFAKHLNALHAARRAFIETESSERIRRALRHRIRSQQTSFDTGDKVYYKRLGEGKWRGPATVIGQDGKTLFIRHGSVYCRVASCHVMKVNSEFVPDAVKSGDEIRDQSRSAETNRVAKHAEVTDSDSDDDSSDVVESSSAAVTSRKTPSELKAGVSIEFREADDVWQSGKVVGRAGKKGGRYSDWYNVKVGEEVKSIDFKEGVKEWRMVELEPSMDILIAHTSTEDVHLAKMTELKNWQEFNVYDEVPYIGQKVLSTRWVITEKGSSYKARLVVRGFEECLEEATDSPTVSKDSVRLFVALSAASSWQIMSMDVKSAFLQGDCTERDIFVAPPRESGTACSVVWKLRKVVYGLADASRKWYFSLKNELVSLNCYPSVLDKAVFRWYDGPLLSGIFIIHVDDFVFAGTISFHQNVVAPLQTKFQISSQCEGCFTYVGLELNQLPDRIEISQNRYAASVMPLKFDADRHKDKNADATRAEKEMLRSLIGQLNWVANHTRPDLAFDVLYLGNCLHRSTVSDLIYANKVVKKLHSGECKLVFPKLCSTSLRIVLYNDAAHANLPDGYSSCGGRVLFLADANGCCVPLTWSSTKIRRVVKSPLSAEALALVDGLDTTYLINSMVSELLNNDMQLKHLPVETFVDSKSLVDNIRSSKLLSEKRLRVDLASVRQSVERGEVSVTWILRSEQLADCLTKIGASSVELLSIFHSGHFA